MFYIENKRTLYPLRVYGRRMLLLVCCFLAGFNAHAAVSDFRGDWVNIDPATRGITRINITGSGSRYRLRVFGKCRPVDCDWGSVSAYFYTDRVNRPLAGTAIALTAIYIKSYAHSIITIRRTTHNRIALTVFTRFTDNSRRSNYTSTYLLKRKFYRLNLNSRKKSLPVVKIRPSNRVSTTKPAGLPDRRRPATTARTLIQDPPLFRSRDCVSFDPYGLRLQKVRGHWRIIYGTRTLKDFKKSLKEARRSLAIIRHYRFNRQCTVGRTTPFMEYYLTGNRPPASPMPGEDCIGFNPYTLKVMKLEGRWQLANNTRWILDFKHKRRLARKSLRVIRRYRFRKICFVGRPQPSLTYFRR